MAESNGINNGVMISIVMAKRNETIMWRMSAKNENDSMCGNGAEVMKENEA